MQELEQLIRKYWAGETSQEEDHRLLRLLQDYKENYREQIRGTFDKATPVATGDMDADKASDLLKKIHRNLGVEGLEEEQKNKVIVLKKRYWNWAVAASVCAIALSVFLWTPRHRTTLAPAIAVKEIKTPSPLPRLIYLTGGKDSARMITLEDGSAVQLGRNSRLSFYQPFPSDRRDLHLEGYAVFTVAKDKARPFTVYAGGIATRALGTRFSIATDAGKVKVRLLEGKIVVNADTGSRLAIEGVYLVPGQELSVDKNNRSYTVNKISPRPEKEAGPAGAADGKPELVFHKEPLGKVFQKIGFLYKTPLSYQPEELQGLYFTGTFLKSDDLHIVLSAICNVNNLVFTEAKDSITITRSH